MSIANVDVDRAGADRRFDRSLGLLCDLDLISGEPWRHASAETVGGEKNATGIDPTGGHRCNDHFFAESVESLTGAATRRGQRFGRRSRIQERMQTVRLRLTRQHSAQSLLIPLSRRHVGTVLHTEIIYPHRSTNYRQMRAGAALVDIVVQFKVQAIALGDGVASRETESFMYKALDHAGLTVGWAIVSEDGASVYSASELAAGELPDMDVSLRGAVSIARRLQDPLGELVKVAPRVFCP